MVGYDYRCQKCGTWSEVYWSSFEQSEKMVPCCCGGTAIQTWRTAPGLSGVWEPGTRGVKRTFDPGSFDVQAGRVFHSLPERSRYLKERGLEAVGPEEFNRQFDPYAEKEPDWSGLKDAMKEGWEEAKANPNVELPKVDATKAIVTGGLDGD